MMRARIDWFVVVTAMFFAVGCGGGGCGGCAGMEPIPGGFPSAMRHPERGADSRDATGAREDHRRPGPRHRPARRWRRGERRDRVPDLELPPTSAARTTSRFPTAAPSRSTSTRSATMATACVLTPVAVNAQRRPARRHGARAREDEEQPAHQRRGERLRRQPRHHARQHAARHRSIRRRSRSSQDPATGTTKIFASNTQVSQLDTGDYSLGGDVLCYLGNASCRHR